MIVDIDDNNHETMAQILSTKRRNINDDDTDRDECAKRQTTIDEHFIGRMPSTTVHNNAKTKQMHHHKMNCRVLPIIVSDNAAAPQQRNMSQFVVSSTNYTRQHRFVHLEQIIIIFMILERICQQHCDEFHHLSTDRRTMRTNRRRVTNEIWSHRISTVFVMLFHMIIFSYLCVYFSDVDDSRSLPQFASISSSFSTLQSSSRNKLNGNDETLDTHRSYVVAHKTVCFL